MIVFLARGPSVSCDVGSDIAFGFAAYHNGAKSVMPRGPEIRVVRYISFFIPRDMIRMPDLLYTPNVQGVSRNIFPPKSVPNINQKAAG